MQDLKEQKQAKTTTVVIELFTMPDGSSGHVIKTEGNRLSPGVLTQAIVALLGRLLWFMK